MEKIIKRWGHLSVALDLWHMSNSEKKEIKDLTRENTMKLLISMKEPCLFTNGLNILNLSMSQLYHPRIYQPQKILLNKYLKMVQELMFLLKKNIMKMELILLKNLKINTKSFLSLILMIILVFMMEMKWVRMLILIWEKVLWFRSTSICALHIFILITTLLLLRSVIKVLLFLIRFLNFTSEKLKLLFSKKMFQDNNFS